MKKTILLSLVVFISSLCSAYIAQAAINSMKYRQIEQVTVFSSEYLDKNNLNFAKFEDKISEKESVTCYVVYKPTLPQYSPTMSCVR